MDEAKNQINDLEDKEAKINQSQQQKEYTKKKKNEDSISSLWDNSKTSNICITGVPEEEKQQEVRNIFEKIMKENFSNLVKKIDMQVQETKRVPNKMDAKMPSPRRIITKMSKVKR